MNDKTETPRWYSPDGTPIHVYLPDGSKAIVAEDPRELPRKFWKAAGRAGCMTTGMPNVKDMQPPQGNPEDDAETRIELIAAAIQEAMGQEEDAPGYEDAFTNAGKPNVQWLSKKVGFTVTAADRDEAYDRVELEGEEEESED
jgi:hypothetical protein